MKLNLKFSALALCVSLSMAAQQQPVNGRGCATRIPPVEWDSWLNERVLERNQNMAAGKSQASTFNIPVVVHVIYGSQAVGTYPNLSVAQINSQIAVLNADFAGTGYNVGDLANTQFASIGAANCNISFCLAQLDPNGNAMANPGIHRVSYSTIGSGANPNQFSSANTFQAYIDNTIKPATIWDPTRYFNIWITDVNSGVGLLGYATFPAASGLTGLSGTGGLSSMQNDGIWVYSKAFGSVGSNSTLQSPYNKGRTATHETGHYLGLRHIGGDGQQNGTGNSNPSGDCSATDYCNDTPPQKGGYGGGQNGQNWGSPPYAQPLNANVCTSTGDMFMNFMDYTDDASNYMFTPNQRTRMQTALTSSPYRNQLTASSSTMCGMPMVMPVADFAITNQTCIDTTIQANNETTGSPSLTYSWSSNPSNGVIFSPSPTSANPNIQFTGSGGTYNITMVATNGAGSTSAVNNVVVSDCSLGVPDAIGKNSLLYRSINLSPNPSSGMLNIITSLPGSQDIEISIHNSLGQLVYTNKYTGVTVNTYALNLETYSGGVYTVTISNGSEKAVKRLILNH